MLQTHGQVRSIFIARRYRQVPEEQLQCMEQVNPVIATGNMTD
jgi:hypothetical protein